MLLPEFTPCVISKNNWNTNKDKTKSMIRALIRDAWYMILWLAKKHIKFSGWNNIKEWKIKLAALPRIMLDWKHLLYVVSQKNISLILNRLVWSILHFWVWLWLTKLIRMSRLVLGRYFGCSSSTYYTYTIHFLKP